MKPTRTQTFIKKPLISHKLIKYPNITVGLSRPSDRPHGQPRMLINSGFAKRTLPLRKNHDRGPQIFTHQPLNFQDNMFAVDDFT
jgi:hypothetical protein